MINAMSRIKDDARRVSHEHEHSCTATRTHQLYKLFDPNESRGIVRQEHRDVVTSTIKVTVKFGIGI